MSALFSGQLTLGLNGCMNFKYHILMIIKGRRTVSSLYLIFSGSQEITFDSESSCCLGPAQAVPRKRGFTSSEHNCILLTFPQLGSSCKAIHSLRQTVQRSVTGSQAWKAVSGREVRAAAAVSREAPAPRPGLPPSAPDLAPPPLAPPAPRFLSDAGGLRSLADVTPRAEVTFSRGWTRRSVAGRGRARPVFLRGR